MRDVDRKRTLAVRREGLGRALARIGLPAWFAVIDLLWIVKPDVLAIDARHYQRAASAWLAGGDPWSVAESGVYYAAGPHTLLFYAPTSILPLSVAVTFWMVLGLAAAAWLVRRLGLPAWWLLFPPLAHAVWNGNPQTLMLALLLVGHPLASAAAVGLKLYGAIPLLARPRHLLVAAVALIVTLPLVPWQQYLADGLAVSHLEGAWNGSAWRIPILIPPTLLGLWVLRRHGAEWLAVPAVWPETQFYYVSTALPAVRGRPFLAAALALPMPLMTPVIVMLLAIVEVLGRRLCARFPRAAPAIRAFAGAAPGWQAGERGASFAMPGRPKANPDRLSG